MNFSLKYVRIYITSVKFLGSGCMNKKKIFLIIFWFALIISIVVLFSCVPIVYIFKYVKKHTGKLGATLLFFIKKGKIVPLAKPALNTKEINTKKLTLAGDAPKGTVYELYEDDGITTDISLKSSIRKIEK